MASAPVKEEGKGGKGRMNEGRKGIRGRKGGKESNSRKGQKEGDRKKRRN